jgi:DNA polymerase-1
MDMNPSGQKVIKCVSETNPQPADGHLMTTRVNKLYVVDAVNYLFRAYFAIAPMSNPKGVPTQALYGFIRSIQKLIKEQKPSYLVAVFDGPNNKRSRQAIYQEYKAHRKQAPDDLVPQFDLTLTYCKAQGIPILQIDGIEADDTIASIAKWAKQHNITSYLCTSDKDLMQLVDDTTFILNPAKDHQLIDKDKVQELFGVTPAQMLDLLAMMGDSSDNIPGLPGFGSKTAALLLQEFHSLDNLLNHPDKVKGAKKQQTLKEHRDLALLSRSLATLNTQIPIPQEPSFYQLQDPDVATLGQFYEDMHFQTLQKELLSQWQRSSDTTLRYHTVTSPTDLHRVLTLFKEAEEIAIDIESTSLQFMDAHIVGIALSRQPKEAFYIPFNGPLDLTDCRTALNTFFQTTKGRFVGHHIKFDLHLLQREGLTLSNVYFDTLLASHLLYPERRHHDLDILSLEHLKIAKIPIETLIGQGKKTRSMADVPIEQVSKYACEDVDCTLQLKNLFEPLLQTSDLLQLFYDIEMPLIPILWKMEEQGIYLDIEVLAHHKKNLETTLSSLTQALLQYAPEPINLNSPKQLHHLLFEVLKIPKPKSKTAFATGADVLESIRDAHPIIDLLLQYRTLEKLRTTYLEALVDTVSLSTQKVHCTFNQSVTSTGRLSCQHPNLQNIPVRTKEGNAIRSAFRPQDPAFVFLSADYSQIELRLLAHFAKDPTLCQAFLEGGDIHLHTAARLFQIQTHQVTQTQRSKAKTVNFGILYGQGAVSLAKQLHMSTKEASQFIKHYFETYPGVHAYLESCKEEARSKGEVVTLFHRRRPLADIHSPNHALRAAAERLAINTPLQGTVADLIKQAMILIDQELQLNPLAAHLLLQIHDELLFEVRHDQALDLAQKVQYHMEHAIELDVPLVVNIAVGKNWAEC